MWLFGEADGQRQQHLANQTVYATPIIGGGGGGVYGDAGTGRRDDHDPELSAALTASQEDAHLAEVSWPISAPPFKVDIQMPYTVADPGILSILVLARPLQHRLLLSGERWHLPCCGQLLVPPSLHLG
jgi:hypothetical protein